MAITSERIEKAEVTVVYKDKDENAQNKQPEETLVRELRQTLGQILNEFAVDHTVKSITVNFQMEDN